MRWFIGISFIYLNIWGWLDYWSCDWWILWKRSIQLSFEEITSFIYYEDGRSMNWEDCEEVVWSPRNDGLPGNVFYQTRRHDGDIWWVGAVTHNPCGGVLVHCAEHSLLFTQQKLCIWKLIRKDCHSSCLALIFLGRCGYCLAVTDSCPANNLKYNYQPAVFIRWTAQSCLNFWCDPNVGYI